MSIDSIQLDFYLENKTINSKKASIRMEDSMNRYAHMKWPSAFNFGHFFASSVKFAFRAEIVQ